MTIVDADHLRNCVDYEIKMTGSVVFGRMSKIEKQNTKLIINIHTTARIARTCLNLEAFVVVDVGKCCPSDS